MTGEYLGNLVLEDEPNENGGIRYQYNRKEYLLDTNVGLQLLSDVAPHINQNHSWFSKGRENAWRLRGLLYALQGKRRPIWVPSFFADFELAEDAADDATVLTVRRCGYADIGGPFTHRDHILIHMRDGTRLYRKLLDGAVVGEEGLYEEIVLDAPTGVALTPDSVLRISFITFCRLDQDSIELVHHSDSKGVTTATLVWRTDPGIGGTYSETVTEIPDLNEENPDLPEVFDPFRLPDQVLLGYSPFAALGHAEPPQLDPPTPATFAWQQFVPDEEVGFSHDLIEIETGNDGFSLPLTGSFKISMMSWFDFDFFIPNFVRFWIELENTTLDPFEVELEIDAIDDPDIFFVSGSRYRTTAPLVIPTIGRMSIASVVVDPDQPIVIKAYHITEGFLVDTGGPVLGGNSFAAPAEDGVIEPYTEGDSFIKIEWWDS